MLDLVGNPEDRFSHNEAQMLRGGSKQKSLHKRIVPGQAYITLQHFYNIMK